MFREIASVGLSSRLLTDRRCRGYESLMELDPEWKACPFRLRREVIQKNDGDSCP